jgi:hypothetical protein
VQLVQVRARYAGAPESAITTVKRANARSVADRRCASITAAGASARYARALPSAPINVSRARARSVTDRRYASIIA